MKVFFTCTTLEFEKYKKYYYAIRRFIISENHILTRDWLLNIKLHPKKFEETRNGSEEIYNFTMKAANEADCIIVEDTVSNFSTGHIITFALQRNKPVLVLYLKNSKEGYFAKNLIHGIKSDYLQVSEYTLKNYKKVIRSFLKKYNNAKEKNRFHLVLDNVERNYLDWAQFNHKESRTKIIRESIRHMIEQDDTYQKYLKK